MRHDSDCSTNNRGVPDLLGLCNCRLRPSLVAHNLIEYSKLDIPLGDYAKEMLREAAHVVMTARDEGIEAAAKHFESYGEDELWDSYGVVVEIRALATQEDQRSEAERIADSRSKSSTQSSDHHTTADDLLRDARLSLDPFEYPELCQRIDAHLNRKEV